MRSLSAGTNAVDRDVVDGAVNGIGLLARGTGRVLRGVQSGNVQRYAIYVFVGAAALVIGAVTQVWIAATVLAGLLVLGLVRSFLSTTARERA